MYHILACKLTLKLELYKTIRHIFIIERRYGFPQNLEHQNPSSFAEICTSNFRKNIYICIIAINRSITAITIGRNETEPTCVCVYVTLFMLTTRYVLHIWCILTHSYFILKRSFHCE